MWGIFFEIFCNILKNIYFCFNKTILTKMGTNYYRIPKVEEIESRKQKLIKQVTELNLRPGDIECGFRVPIDDQWNSETPWDTFINGTNIHLGKRSSGWKFCWNFHDKKYFSNKEELLTFIRSGRVVDEYGEEQEVEGFIEMALSWGEPDGLVANEKYRKEQRVKGMGSFFDDPRYDDLIIDGLRVSTSTDFC
jgi:hypothetical protein